ncbi:MAG: glycoside hydrolase family 3 protein [Gammaproteobacteria bacterium]|nr:glycoside hydrolase family 3 protein [Gammaproteobacteria bacterium]MDH5652883.1 glycoside hydrolase family 3 protein [Gammaproteobacteria bacterium]
MRIIGHFLVVAFFLTGLFWSFNLRDPHLLPIRGYELFLLNVLWILAILIAMKIQAGYRYMLLPSVVIILLIINLSVYQYRLQKTAVLNQPTQQQRTMNQRLVIGFKDLDEIRKLSLNGIAGIFITRRNIEGKTSAEVRDFILQLQTARKQAGLPSLIVATDQEGGPVSRLSPLVESQPALSTLLDNAQPAKDAFVYGDTQGAALQDLGITVNFSPVVDLKPDKAPAAMDFHTLINIRAISAEPPAVISIALPYIKGLEKHGINATLKHFPGLGRVSTDTHHFSAHLDTPVDQLIKIDWQPFIQLTRQTGSWIMLSHVILSAVDAENPVSTSNAVVNDIIRNKLGFKGTLITDDLTMGATYNRGFCKSVQSAYGAGINYLLISYDHEKYYDAIGCLTDSFQDAVTSTN